MLERVRPHVAWAVFPAVVAGSIALAILAMARGLAPAAAAGLGQAAGLGAVVALGRLFPYDERWRRPRADVRTDLSHAVVSGLAAPEALRPFAHAGAVLVGGWLSRTLGMGLWPSGWPLLAQLALALVVGELGQYWFHRWQHETELLWRVHATHHSAERLYWLNAGRFHPIDFLMLWVAWYAPLVALGCGGPVLALFAVFTAVHGLFQHANLEVRLGPLNWIFSMAELHRWHHSRTVSEANHNYGANLIVWDVVFGTRFLPRGRRPPTEIGIADLPAFPKGYFAQLASPFRWERVRREASGGLGEV